MRHTLLQRLEDRLLLAGTPTLVADLNTHGLPSYPSEFTVFQNALYFTAYDNVHGGALWRYDGTQTTMVADIDPAEELYASVGPQELTVFDGALYFRALNHASGLELWKYDGTSASLAADIKPNFSTDPQSISSRPSGLTVIGDRLYFSADDGVTGREIWSFDGQIASRLADLNPGKGDSEPYGKTYRFTEFAGAMYFIANAGDNRDHLFRFDGQNIARIDQAGGTPLLSDFYDDELIVFDGALYFTGAAPGQNLDREFWKFDGTTFSRVADIRQGPDGSWPSGYFTFNDKLYFWAQRDVSIGLELFKFDGQSVTPVTPFPHDPGNGSGSGSQVNVLDGNAYLTLAGNLYRFDGSTMTRVSDVPVARDSTVFGNAIYLSGEFQTSGAELARYNGASIELVADIQPGTETSYPTNFSLFDGKLYFTADSDQSSHAELWVYDGSTARIADPSRQYFEPVSLVNLNGKLYFTAANANDVGWDLWRYDGDHSTKVLGDDNGFNFYPAGTISFGGMLLLRGYSYSVGGDDSGQPADGLWAFDGMEANLIAPGLWVDEHFADPSRFAVFDGSLYFLASQTYGAQLELWKFDGTNVQPAPGIEPGALTPQGDMKVYDGALYLGAKDSASSDNYELWKYDGSAATLAAEIRPGDEGSYPRGFAIHEGSLYFGASGDQFASQLWRYNATSGAQRITSTLTAGPAYLATLAGVLYFFANDGSSISGALWSYDGVEARQISDLLMGSSFFHFADGLYFGADDGLHGYELWKLEPDVPTGDLNRDGTVSIGDFVALSSNFGKSNAGWADGDLNYDNQVTIADFIELSANFGKSNAPPAPAAATTASRSATITPTVPKKARKIEHVKRLRRHAHHRAPNRQARITLLRF